MVRISSEDVTESAKVTVDNRNGATGNEQDERSYSNPWSIDGRRGGMRKWN